MARRRAGREYGSWRRYVPVAERRRQASAHVRALAKRGVKVDPVEIEGRLIVRTFWGEAWCTNLERYGDFANRLPRGRTYVRNGSVLHLHISEGVVDALVQGSETYEVRVRVRRVEPIRWERLVERCAGAIESLVELLSGRISDAVMTVMTAPGDGLFPAPKEITMECSCPDWAVMCKHVAGVLYGVGARLDREPAHLFRLRGVDPADLLDVAVTADITSGGDDEHEHVLEGDLEDVFGIELEPEDDDVETEPVVDTGHARDPVLVRRAELLDAGVPPGTISTWLFTGVLQKTGVRAVYEHTPDSLERLARRR